MKLFYLIVSILLSQYIFAQSVKIANADSWVVQRNTAENFKPANFEISEGSYLKLIDVQVNVSLQKEYFHFINELINETGVQNNSQIDVEFDPSFQKLVFHHIRIIRENKIIELLNINGFKILRQENDLSRFLYNGTYASLFIIKDVRVGDKIEYDYTIEGFNPVFKGKFYNQYQFQGSEPVGSAFYSVIMPEGRKLYFKNFNNAPEPSINKISNNQNKYEWSRNAIKAKFSEDFQPEWYEDFPKVQVSEMTSLQDVVDWSLSIQPSNDHLSDDLKNKINEFKKASSTNNEYIKKCIRFVQDDIRYMGIELNIYSQQPHSANQTFRQRYGDCKDKSILLCAMLNYNNIEAYPVYINTFKRNHTDELLPSPLNFNHCVCTFNLNGTMKYIDPTYSLQRGLLSKFYFPGYGKGLIIKSGQNELTEIKESESGSSDIKEKFTINDVEDDGSLEVVSKYSGADADEMRNNLQESSLKSIEKSYLDFYSKLYDSVEVKNDISISDDDIFNTIIVKESYLIKHPWKLIKNMNNNFIFEVSSSLVNSHLTIIPKKVRESPLRIKYPIDLQYSIEVETPDKWVIKEEEIPVNNNFFNFNFSVYKLDKGFILNYKYKALKNEVPVEKISFYNKEIDSLTSQLGYKITWNKNLSDVALDKSFKLNISFIIIAIFFLITFIVLSTRIYRISFNENYIPSFYNINGLLILPLIGLLFSTFRFVYTIFSQNFFNEQFITQLKTNLTTENTNWDAIFIFEIGGNIFLASLGILCFVSFVKKRDILPRLMTWYYLIKLLILGIDHFVAININTSTVVGSSNFYSSLLGCIIWIPYFLTSTQVKNTFIVPYGYIKQENEKGNSSNENIENEKLIE